MPYTIRKLANKKLYRVTNPVGKKIHSFGTSLKRAKRQVRLLHMMDAKKDVRTTRPCGCGHKKAPKILTHGVNKSCGCGHKKAPKVLIGV